MARDWEAQLRIFAKPSSDTEQTRCDNAVRMVRDAVLDSDKLSNRKIEIFAQGSYRNNTNVRQDSDVDICILCYDACFPDFSSVDGLSMQDVGLIDAGYSFAQYKNDVEEALNTKFGKQSVNRGNKAFHISENSYRVEADVVPGFEHRRYTSRNVNGYLSGVEIVTDAGLHIRNWPEQNYENGVLKNTNTGNRYKFITRGLKRLRNEIAEFGVGEANSIPSYLLECLVWNVPNNGFGHDAYLADMRWVLAHTCNETRSDTTCNEWGEVNELKYLFGSSQQWTRKDANLFVNAAWKYIGFE